MKPVHMMCALSFLLAIPALQAAPVSVTLPPETAKLKPSKLPGYTIAVQKCATCHSADYIEYQPPRMTLDQWTKEAAKMQHMFGAPITDDDVRKVGAYLAVTYGSAKASELVPELRATAAPAAAAAANAQRIDVKALLAANACLGCHAVETKVVGPAYRDVAAKYRTDSGALDKVAASIRAGGSGKWGAVPMPPFTQLKPEEARALAGFVLGR